MRKKLDNKSFIEKASKTHNCKYSYLKLEYKFSKDKVVITCPEHGDFIQNAASHLRGNGCPKCAGNKQSNVEEIVEKFNKVHDFKYDYSNFKSFKNINDKVDIVCKEHGSFNQIIKNHLKGHGCSKCGGIEGGKKLSQGLCIFSEKSNIVHENKYDYSLVRYISNDTNVDIVCPKHGIFSQKPANHLHKQQGCPKCKDWGKSKTEKEISEFLKDLTHIEESDRKILNGKELDIYIPELNLAIEFNGLYWHSENFKTQNEHLLKTLECNSNNIRLIHIFEDEWIFKKEIVKSRLLNLIGETPNKIHARKCEIREVDSKDTVLFLNENHIQGNVNSKIKLGLYYKEELVSLMTFGSFRKNLGQTSKKDCYELLRFCNKLNTTVVGGASKLLKHFIKNNKPKEIISYADRRWSEGDIYEKLGFILDSESSPNYFYFKNLKRENRFKYRKSELVKQGFDPSKTEKQIMKERGFSRIYDCGTLKYKIMTNYDN